MSKRFHIMGVLCAFAILSSASILRAEPEQFIDTWINIDNNPEYISKLDISWSRNELAVEAWSYCPPRGCNLGVMFNPGASNPFVIQNSLEEFDLTISIELLNDNLLKVISFVDYHGNVDDMTYTDFLYRQDRERPMPDLVISDFTIQSHLIKGHEQPWTWAFFKVTNAGPGVFTGQEILARIENATRDGQDFEATGLMDISFSSPMAPGDSAFHQFAPVSYPEWTAGQYTMQLKVDYDNYINEANEQNNLSSVLSFDVVEKDKNFLIGQLRYNNQPVSNYTDAIPAASIANLDSNQFIEGFDLHYNNQNGRYLLSGIEADNTRVFFNIIKPATETSSSEHYTLFRDIDFSILDEAAASNYYLHFKKLIHLLEPHDSDIVLPGAYENFHNCRPLTFSWEPLEGAVYYKIRIDSLRDIEHPQGFGFINTVVDTQTNDTSFIADLPVLDSNEFYRTDIYGYNSLNQQLGFISISFTASSGAFYDFIICDCVIADLNQDCRVDLVDLSIFSEYWLNGVDD